MAKFSYSLGISNVKPVDQQLVDGKNLISGVKSFAADFGDVTPLERDLLNIASAIFAADRASPRGEREEYRRFIYLELPVSTFDTLDALAPLLTRLLRRLSQDVWTVRFIPAPSVSGDKAEASVHFPALGGDTLLFSGGLDSLSAAVEFGLSERPLLLSSHVTRNPATDGAQREIVERLLKSGFNVEHKQFFVSSKNGGPQNLQHDLEPSQRTRSLVFLTLAVLSARRTGRTKVIAMAENGQMAIHLPLSAARIGAFSTHTAHPSVLALAQQFFSSVLGYEIQIENPYVYKTKAEVVAPLFGKAPETIELSTSCWKNARAMANGARHCGQCVPCLIRRIALSTCGHDPTVYAVDLLKEDVASLPPEHDGRRNLVDLAEFAVRFSKNVSDIHSEFPELISSDFDSSQAIAMYSRFAAEAHKYLSKYPHLMWLLQ